MMLVIIAALVLVVAVVAVALVALRRLTLDYEKEMMPAPARRSENKAEALAREVAIEIGQEAEADEPAFVEHTVTGEDTLQGILIHYGAKLSDLQRDNGFTGKNFQMCNVLKIRSTAPAMDPRAETAETKYKRCLQSFIEAATKSQFLHAAR